MNPKPTSILCFRNGSIGNTLVAVPAMRALRQSFPDAKLAVVVDPMGFELLRHCPWIDDVIVYDKRGRDRGLMANARLVLKLRGLRPSHAVLFKRFFRNGLLAYASGAPVRAGFVTDGRAPFLNLTIPYDESLHHVDMNLRLVEELDARPSGRDLEIFLSEDDRHAASRIITALVPPEESYVCAHYGGHTWFSENSISVEHFAELLHRVAEDRTVLLIGSGSSEAAWADSISAAHSKAIPCCNLPVRTAAGLIEQADLFIGFNSGPSHIAAAVKTPLLMLFEPGARAHEQITRWLPPSENAYPVVPPAGNDPSAWGGFLEEAIRLTCEIRKRPERSQS